MRTKILVKGKHKKIFYDKKTWKKPVLNIPFDKLETPPYDPQIFSLTAHSWTKTIESINKIHSVNRSGFVSKFN